MTNKEQLIESLKANPKLRPYANYSIAAMAATVADDWKKVYFGARPYLDAMYSLPTVDDNYGEDSGRSIVAYFLCNATTWKGEIAKAIKKELNLRIKAKK